MLIHGHTVEELQKMPCESVDMILTSPPYFGLRSYQSVPQIWGGTAGCVHEWILHNKKWHSGTNAGRKQLTDEGAFHNNFSNETNFCIHCNAWKGELGLEPTHSLYIEHLMSVFDELQRVLKKAGTCWVNIGDSYNGAKSLIAIPECFMIAMIDRGWICRNVIIWWKRSCMPESVDDRFTRDFEYLYYFTKHKDSYFEKQFENNSAPLGSPRKFGHTGNKDRNDTDLLYTPNHQGRNKRTVWDIPTQPLLIDMCLTCGHIYDSGHSIKISRKGDKMICYFCNGTEFASHYASYPVALCKTPIMAGCPADGIVLDPFIGSGSTAIAAKELGRDYIGIDISEKYLNFAQYRIERTTKGMQL